MGKRTGFVINPQNINKKWRPKNRISLVVDELREMWIEVPKSTDIKNMYLMLCSLNERELKEIIEKEESTIIAKTLAKDLLEKWTIQIIETLLDRSLWKPTQAEEITAKQEIVHSFKLVQ